MKKKLRIILIVLLLIIAALVGFIFAWLKGIPITHKGLKYVEKYRTDQSIDYVHFTEQDFGEYEDIHFQVRDVNGLFRSVGAMYTVKYSPEQYEKQKAAVEGFDYLNESENQDEDGSYYMPSVKIEKNDWTFRVLDNGDYESYPKEFGMIGTNDETQTMVYMYFTDADLDYISEESGDQALEDFIEEYFNFKF